MSGTIDSVRGMRDLAPEQAAHQLAVAARLEQTLASYGYEPIDLPIVERRDLYLRKLGEELVGKVYEFSFNGRALALRPEWTASVLRAYTGWMQDQPLPLRLRYAGPVFRNERPQRDTYRQFTQIGVELIGGPAPRADAECLALACAGLDAAGVADYRVQIGHIGLIRSLLSALGLADRTQGLLVWSLERMRAQGVAAVRSQLDPGEAPPVDPALLEGIDDAQAEALLLHALAAIGVNLQYGTRPPEAIVQRLVRKLRRSDSQADLDRALQLLDRLSQLHGPPAEVLPRAAALIREFGLPEGGLDDLAAIIALAEAHGIAPQRLAVDFGLGRGLHYYTGVIFEIFAPDGLQLCGGGRYDDLVTALGGRQPVPAVGFAYGLERVVSMAQVAAPPGPPQALVVAADDASYPYALRVAALLRERGFVASSDVRGRNLAGNIRDASRRGLRVIVAVDAERMARDEVLWRDLPGRAEQVLALRDLPEA